MSEPDQKRAPDPPSTGQPSASSGGSDRVQSEDLLSPLPTKAKLALGASPRPLLSSFGSSSRMGLHDKLRAYESRRRLTYAAKLESSSLYWKSFRDLLAASVQETARAQRLVLGTSRAHQLYADAMQAMYEDVFLDDKGNTMLKAKQQKKLSQGRRKPTKKDGRSVLTAVRRVQHTLAQRFGENAKNMDVEIAEEIGRLLVELKEKVAGMEKLGSSILSELEKTEQEVSEAWSSYYTVAMDKPNASGSLPSPPMNMGGPEETAPKPGNEADIWLYEMQYRVAVAYQNMAWEKGSVELEKLFKSMKEEECRRRMNLRELLVAFVQRQQRLFLSLPAVQNPVLEELVERQIDLEEIEESVQAAIRAHVPKQDADVSKKDNSLGGTLEKLEGAEEEVDFTLESPLKSDLLCKAKVVERRQSGVMKGWKASLGIITADSYLHLFDLPPQRTQQGLDPEVAFRTLIPGVIIPTLENLKYGKSNFSKGWSETISPTESMILSNCTIQPRGDESFEINETVAATVASKMFGKKVSRKMVLRTASKKETEDWIEVLKSPL